MSVLLELQSGVISRRQLHERGVTPAQIEKALRRKELVRPLPGVFVNHTGEAAWLQRAWIGVLYYWPAALAGQSALRVVAGPGWRHHADGSPLQIAVDVRRTVRGVPGFRPVRMAGLEGQVLWNASPPRVRPEVAAIDVAARARSELSRIAVLADICQTRRTTAERVLSALEDRARVRDRAWLRGVLTDIRDGTCSVLEHGYLTRIERAHGLPMDTRQDGCLTPQGAVLRDVAYAAYDFYVELDGRLFHDSAGQRDVDLDRDLDAAVLGRGTIRLGWGQVFDRPCRTTERLAALLRRGGWPGTPRRCGPGCSL